MTYTHVSLFQMQLILHVSSTINLHLAVNHNANSNKHSGCLYQCWWGKQYISSRFHMQLLLVWTFTWQFSIFFHLHHPPFFTIDLLLFLSKNHLHLGEDKTPPSILSSIFFSPSLHRLSVGRDQITRTSSTTTILYEQMQKIIIHEYDSIIG